MPDNDVSDLTNNFTIECWVQPSSVVDGFVFRKGWCYGGDNSYYLRIQNGKIIWVWTSGGNCDYANSYQSTNEVITSGECAHISIVHSDTEIIIYLNNEIISGELTNGSYSTIYNSDESMSIGAFKNYSGEYAGFYSGKIDELRFWNYKLTQQEIIDYSSAPLNGDEVGLVAYFDMEDTGVGTNLTITNKATVSGEITGTAFGSATSPYFTYSCSSVGIEDIIEEEQVQIYPNPSSDIIYLNGYNNIKSISLININGQIVKRFSNSTKININLSSI